MATHGPTVNNRSDTTCFLYDGTVGVVPVGAVLKTCSKGANEGKHYWVRAFINQAGRADTAFVGWVEKPAPYAQTKIALLEERLVKLEEQMEKFASLVFNKQ